jgi:dTMP kinase
MTQTQRAGLFITFEGGEGSGKTTQSQLLAERLGAVWTREPGGTELGRAIRELCLGERFDPSARCELLLMGADRAAHVDEVIAPALARGETVVCDRFSASTRAYQGAGRGLDDALIDRVIMAAEGGVRPDAVVVVSVDAATRATRLAERGGEDRMERAGSEFHERVEASFLAQANADATFVVVNGEGTVDEVHQRVLGALAGLLGACFDALVITT